jgi:SAM-dependent methyltransferase
MERATYEHEARLERTHWWFRGRRKILSRILAKLDLPSGARVLDLGCGTGANGPVLAENGRFVVGVDASSVPLGLGGARGHAGRLRGDALRLPFADRSFDLVVALDVLEHLDDDHAAARELGRVARPGAGLVVFVPALEILWGLQDDVSHHRRRYGRRGLIEAVQAGGFEVERTTFFNSLLFPPILAARLAMRLRRPATVESENQIGGPLANAVLGGIFGLEAPLLDRIDLPIGVSLACIARRVYDGA